MSDKSTGNWFEDDPEWDELRKTVDGQPILKKQSKKTRSESDGTESNESPSNSGEPKKVELSINVKLPKIQIPKLPKKLHSLKSKITVSNVKKHKKIVFPASFAVIVIISGAVFYGLKNKVSDTQNPTGVLADVSQSPDFKVLRPKDDKSASKLQYDGKLKVASFTDKIEFTEVTVSQQELPETFKADPDAKLDELAKSINANEVINESSPKAYLGTSIKGPQTAVFHKNGLLVFIKSPNSIEKSAWAAYITNLL